MTLQVSIVIPAYNEEKRIPGFLDELASFFKSSAAPSYEIIVVDDGSTDNLPAILKGYKEKDLNIRLLRLNKNRGKGAAIAAGVSAALGQYIVCMDADGAYSPEYISHVSILLAEAELVVGSRERQHLMSLKMSDVARLFLSKGFNCIVRLILGIKNPDTQCGFKAGRASPLKDIFQKLTEHGFAFDLELLMLANDLKYNTALLPVVARPREGTRIRLLSPFEMIASIIKLRFGRHDSTPVLTRLNTLGFVEEISLS